MPKLFLLLLPCLLLISCSEQQPEESNSYTHPQNIYSIQYPVGWYPHELKDTVALTREEEFSAPSGTEGYVLGEQILISVLPISEIAGVKNFDEWLEANGMVEGSDSLIKKKEVEVNGLKFVRSEMHAAGAGTRVLHYIHPLSAERLIILSHYPYKKSSSASKDFEFVVESFKLSGS